MPCLNTPVPEKAKTFPFAEKVPFCCVLPLSLLNQQWAEQPAHRASNSIARHPSSCRIDLSGSKGLADASTTLPGVQADLLTGNNSVGLLDNLLSLGEDQLDVAGVGHVGVDLESLSVCMFVSRASMVCAVCNIDK